MSADVTPGQVRAWLDDAVLETVEQVADGTAAFNFRTVYAGTPVHVVKPRPGGPIVVGGQVAVEEDRALGDLPEFDRRQLRARIRERLTAGPVLYYFLDDAGNNVAFRDLEQVRIEQYVYPDAAGQHALMTAVFEVAKRLFYLRESIAAMVENVESRR